MTKIADFFIDVVIGLFRNLRANTLLRWLGTPFQRLFDKVGKTHEFLTIQGMAVLENDGYENAARFCGSHKDAVIDGNYWADTLWMNATHHYNPKTGRGLLVWPGAPDQLKYWFGRALKHWRGGECAKAMFTLGACLHIVQDCCQPYHSNCKALSGHQKYETWVDQNKEQFAVQDGGMYGASTTPEGWAHLNASYSHTFLEGVCKVLPSSEKERQDGRRAITADLLARAQRTTAGFIMFFLGKALESGEKACVTYGHPEDLLARQVTGR